MIVTQEIRHFHMCGGSGSGAAGFNDGSARLGNIVVKPRCLGSIDVDPAGCIDFEMMTGTKATCLDLFDEYQYRAFHGSSPPIGWRPATPGDVWRAQQCETPDVAFASYPCKGFSGLLSETASQSAKYQALNAMTERGMFLLLEANRNNPIKIILFENVPRIATRGRKFLDEIKMLARAYDYEIAETEHDCGELGNLGQSRKRFLMVMRHAPQVPNFLYEPPKYPLRGVGEILDKLPMPLTGFGGPLHRMPALQWKTWVRLALVEAGSDWRSLNKLIVEDGFLKDFGIALNYGIRGVLGVTPWDEPAGVVKARSLPTNGAHAVADPRVERQARRTTLGVADWSESTSSIRGESMPSNGAFSVSDPRVNGHPKSVQLSVRPWSRPAGVITGKMIAGGGPNSVADPRMTGTPFNHVYRVVRYSDSSPAVAGPGGPAGGLAVADVRLNWHPGASSSKMRVTPWEGEAARPITGSQQVGSGAGAIQDPRPAFARDGREQYLSAGHYGVVPFDGTSRAITGTGQHDNGFNSVADPSALCNFEPEYAETGPDMHELPAADQKVVCVIRSIDGTWHRPFTTLECAALQSMFDPEKYFTAPEVYWDLHGMSDSAKRERIGNAVPRASAKGMASAIYLCLLHAMNGETFTLSSMPIWVQPVALALAAAEGVP